MADGLKQLTSANQTDSASLFASLQSMLNRGKLDTDGMIPAQIVSFDRAKNTATVKPLIHWVGLDDKPVERWEITEIPVLSLGGGGFHISFPLNAGDLGWIFAGDRDISEFVKELKPAAPPNGRSKQFSDGLFIPDVFRQYTINSEDSSAMVIQSVDGASRISIRGDNIKITTPGNITLDTPMVNMTQQLTVNGKATFKGGIEGQTGTTVTLPANSTVGGINVTTHGHTQQNNGSGRTAGGMTS